jgi:hypothetical protein
MKKLGFPEAVVAQIQKMRDWSKALNNTSNVLSSYETLAMKPNNFAERMFAQWMPTRILSSAFGYTDDCYDQGYEESIATKNARPKEERIAEEAMRWFCNLNGEKRHTIIEFPSTHSKTHFDAIKIEANQKQIVTAYLADLEDRRRSEHERVMKLDREARARKAEIAEKAARFGKPKPMVAAAARVPDNSFGVDGVDDI